MIGVIGPRDSIDLARAVASEEGLGENVVTRAYDLVEEAPALARELDEICQVLLFTGRVPFARPSGDPASRSAIRASFGRGPLRDPCAATGRVQGSDPQSQR